MAEESPRHNDDVVMMDGKMIIDPDLHEAIKTPGFHVAHPIYGYLISKGRIESFQIYNRRRRPATIASCRRTTDPVCICLIKLGRNLEGHEGIVHGGILALLIDEVLGLGCEAVTGGLQATAFTANLTIDYRNSCRCGSWVRMAVYLVECKGRKLIWKCRVETPDQSILYCEAKSLFLLPKGADAETIVHGGGDARLVSSQRISKL
jgi:acyl-coenzyme A thioesterase PaaI-like protein